MKIRIFVLAAILLCARAYATEPSENRIALADLAWLEGCWAGTGFGKRVGECWMSAPDGRLTGMFQMIDADGRQTMSEIFVLTEFEDGPAIRLKHFNPDLTGWEDRDEFIVFPLRETGADFARFDGLTYSLADDGRLIVELMVKQGGEASLERLEFKRADRTVPGD